VFGEDAGGYSGWSRSKRRLDERCKLSTPWTLHNLRRSFVTHMAELGIAPPHVIEELVNHVSGHKGGVAGIYDRARYEVEKARAVQAWADHLIGSPLDKAA
jgi:integrase